jgi:hypothetical protein
MLLICTLLLAVLSRSLEEMLAMGWNSPRKQTELVLISFPKIPVQYIFIHSAMTTLFIMKSFVVFIIIVII